jgi:hypothetical protein
VRELIASLANMCRRWLFTVCGERNSRSASELVPGGKDDEAIPPDAERPFAARMGATTIEVSASHLAMVSHPDHVASLIERAAESVGASALG